MQLEDTLGDAALILRRSLSPVSYDDSLLATTQEGEGGRLKLRRSSAARRTVLVVGSGWAAHALIKVIDTERHDVYVVSPRNCFCFTPMLPSSAVGTVEFRSLLEPVRVSNPEVVYVEANVLELDTQRKTALCRPAIALPSGELGPTFEIAYDVAVLAPGEQSATLGVPGVAEHSFYLKEVSDAVRLRKRVAECFELASLPGTSEEDMSTLLHFVVVGGGPTGVEFAGTLADYVRRDVARTYSRAIVGKVKVTLIQSAQTILSQFAKNLQGEALASLAGAGVEVRLGARVSRLDAGCVTLNTGETLHCGVIVWSAGNAARPLVRSISESLHAQRAFEADTARPGLKLAVDPWLRVVGAQDVLALGDASRMHGAPLPATAQVAGQQGAYAARLLNRRFDLGIGGLDQPPPWRAAAATDAPSSNGDGTVVAAGPFDFLSLGLLAYVGNDSALTQLDTGDVHVQLSGRFAFLLWRSVYLTKQVSLRNRVLILFDWMKTRVFGRDISQF